MITVTDPNMMGSWEKDGELYLQLWMLRAGLFPVELSRTTSANGDHGIQNIGNPLQQGKSHIFLEDKTYPHRGGYIGIAILNDRLSRNAFDLYTPRSISAQTPDCTPGSAARHLDRSSSEPLTQKLSQWMAVGKMLSHARDILLPVLDQAAEVLSTSL